MKRLWKNVGNTGPLEKNKQTKRNSEMSYHTCLWLTEPADEMGIIQKNVPAIVFNIKLCFNLKKWWPNVEQADTTNVAQLQS